MRYNKQLRRAQRAIFDKAISEDPQGLFVPSDFAGRDNDVHQTRYLMDGDTCIAGIVIETFDGMSIKRVFVTAAFRGREVCKKIVADVADTARSNGEEALFVQWTPESRAYWERRGFSAVPAGDRNDFGATRL